MEQASQAFDSITYSKGEAVITMLEAYVGPDAWRTGVRNYIKAHAYGNTVSDDLWTAVQAAAGKPIMQIAHDFTLQPGIPLIRVQTERLQRRQDHRAAEPGRVHQGSPGQDSRCAGTCR